MVLVGGYPAYKTAVRFPAAGQLLCIQGEAEGVKAQQGTGG